MRLRTKVELALTFVVAVTIYVETRSIFMACVTFVVLSAFALKADLLDTFAPKQTPPVALQLIQIIVLFGLAWVSLQLSTKIGDFVFLRVIYGAEAVRQQDLHFITYRPLVLSTGEHLGKALVSFYGFVFVLPPTGVVFFSLYWFIFRHLFPHSQWTIRGGRST